MRSKGKLYQIIAIVLALLLTVGHAGFLLSDEDMPDGYWWDTVITPECSGTRTYNDYASYSQLA